MIWYVRKRSGEISKFIDICEYWCYFDPAFLTENIHKTQFKLVMFLLINACRQQFIMFVLSTPGTLSTFSS